jgi:multicomponent Na+:H+ antiporter subunit D
MSSPSLLELLPALVVIVPILGATLPLVLGLKYENVGWAAATVVCGLVFALTLPLVSAVYGVGERVQVIHNLGGFDQPVGIALVADELSTIVVFLVAGVSLATLAYTRVGGPRGNTFYSGYLLLVGGLMGISLTGDVFNLFVFLEITGIATYGLIAKSDGAEAAVAALKYLIIGTVGASLYLVGVGFVFLATGTLNMMDLATAIPEAGYDDPLVRMAFAFMFVGFAIKVAQWPLHTWQPDAYQHAPDGVTPMIAALVSTVSAYALARVIFGVYTVEFVAATPYLQEVIVTVGSVSVVAGSLLAVIQVDVKRMLAFSSVSQFGLIVAAYGLLTETALVGALVHLVGHGIMKAGLFVCAGIVAVGYGARKVDEYAGLFARRPAVASATAVLGIALIGIPPSVGFIGKWYIAVGSVEAELWPVAAVIFLSTMLTLGYVARLLEKMFFTPATGAPATHGVATDGGEGVLVGTLDEADPVSLGMVGLAVFAAVLAVALGFAGGTFNELFDPFVSEVFS